MTTMNKKSGGSKDNGGDSDGNDNDKDDDNDDNNNNEMPLPLVHSVFDCCVTIKQPTYC
jgi:hypothetical protein